MFIGADPQDGPAAGGSVETGTRPPKPTPIEYTLDEIPAYCRARKQWVCWRYGLVKNSKGEWRWTKVPYRALEVGRKAASTRRSEWATFEQAVAAYENPIAKYDGIGYCVDHEDGEVLTMTDADHVVTWTDGKPELAPVAQDVIATLASYTEFSVSGTGVHTFTFGKKPEGRCKRGNLEMYDHSRFFTFTGRKLDGTTPTIESRPEQILAVHAKYLQGPEPPRADVPPSAGPVDEGAALTDSEILTRALAAANGEKFTSLFVSGDTSTYGGDDSAADLALCDLLAFWTGKRADQMDRLFRRSGLMREKWDDPRGRSTYGAITIKTAISSTGETYGSRAEFYEKASPRPTISGASATANVVDSDFKHEVAAWPELNPAALTGLAGRIVEEIAPHSEADPVAILIHTLVAIGNLIGPGPHARVERSRHPARLNAVLVGRSSKGRKGMAWSTPEALMRAVDPTWAVTSGLSSLARCSSRAWPAPRRPLQALRALRGWELGPVRRDRPLCG
jgi:hypothetical protein